MVREKRNSGRKEENVYIIFPNCMSQEISCAHICGAPNAKTKSIIDPIKLVLSIFFFVIKFLTFYFAFNFNDFTMIRMREMTANSAENTKAVSSFPHDICGPNPPPPLSVVIKVRKIDNGTHQ